jgi:hypothetical protein
LVKETKIPIHNRGDEEIQIFVQRKNQESTLWVDKRKPSKKEKKTNQLRSLRIYRYLLEITGIYGFQNL